MANLHTDMLEHLTEHLSLGESRRHGSLFRRSASRTPKENNFAKLPPEMVEKILLSIYPYDLRKLDGLRRVSRQWNKIILSFFDRTFNMKQVWRSNLNWADWNLMLISPNVAVRVLERLLLQKKLMDNGLGRVSTNPVFAKTPYVFLAKWYSSYAWSTTPAFFDALNEQVRDIFHLYFPGVAESKDVTWDLWKYHLDRTIFRFADGPIIRDETDAFLFGQSMDYIRSRLPYQLRVQFPRPIRLKYRYRVYDRLDWEAILDARKRIEINVLLRERNPQHANTKIKRLPGLARVASRIWPEFKYMYLKKKYWNEGIPEKWYKEDTIGSVRGIARS